MQTFWSPLKRNSPLIAADLAQTWSALPLYRFSPNVSGNAARMKQVALRCTRWRPNRRICMKIPVKQQSDSASERAIILRPSLIEKEVGSFHTRDARCSPVLFFFWPMFTWCVFLLFSLLCFSPLTSLFIYLCFFAIARPGIIVRRIEWCELLCNGLIQFPSAARCHQCQSW